MDLQYFAEDLAIVVRFGPTESDEASIIMALVAYEEKRKGTRVPEIGDERLNDMAGSREGAKITFPYEFHQFAIAFLEGISDRWFDLKWDNRGVDEFLSRMRNVSPAGHRLQ